MLDYGRTFTGGAALVGVAACLGEPEMSGTDNGARRAVVPERWVSQSSVAWDLDTPAVWTSDGEARLLVTAKGTHDLRVFDVATGRYLGVVGRPGAEMGAFLRPNAVLVEDDLAFVIERDNHRVQVLELPDGASAGFFGEDVLELPYGGVIDGQLPDITLWITDNYATPRFTPDLSRRLHRFRLRMHVDGTPDLLDHSVFGERGGAGALRFVESIGLDPALGWLLVADESRKQYVVYDTAGEHVAGRALAAGRIRGDPEGIALVECEDGGGYWVVTDQRPDVSLFLLFDRRSFDYVGTFLGRVTANSDGVVFAKGPLPGFGGSAFFAVHDDRAVAAFAWEDVGAALGLDESCW